MAGNRRNKTNRSAKTCLLKSRKLISFFGAFYSCFGEKVLLIELKIFLQAETETFLQINEAESIKFSKMVLIFVLNGKPSFPNTAKGRSQAERLPVLSVNRRDTPPETQRRRQDFSCRQAFPAITVPGNRKASAVRSFYHTVSFLLKFDCFTF